MRAASRSASRDHNEPKHITKHEQIAMLTTLERCTQLHRDDKAQLRRRIRELEEEVIAVFSRHRRPINYQTLQADLRKLAVKNSNGPSGHNKENIQAPSESDSRSGSTTYRLPKKKNMSTQKLPDRKESVGSNQSRKTVYSGRKVDTTSPKNSWFSRLQHKLKFKNQVSNECTPLDVDLMKPTIQTTKLLTPTMRHCEIQQQLNVNKKSNLSTKHIKERILDRQKFRLENVDIDYEREQPKNDMRLSLHQLCKDDFVQNISSLDVSPGRESYSLNDTERKLITEMQLRKSTLKMKPRQSIDTGCSAIFRSEYDINPSKVDLLRELTIFKHRYAQDLINYFFESPRRLLSRQDFFQLMIKLLQEMDVSVRSFETMEQFVTLIIGDEAFITPVMLGNALEVISQGKHSEVRVIFDLLNCHKRKVLAIEDMIEYIEGALKAKQSLARAEYLCYELLYLCSKDGRLSYWDLYLARESPQFLELCNLLTS